MKKQIFTIILLLMGGISTFGQSFKLDATGANDMRLRTSNVDRLTILPTSGNVGIGTTTPNAKLDLNGDLSFTKKRNLTTSGIQNALDRQGASRIFIDVSSTVTLNGIAGGVDGLMIFIYTGSGTTLVINNLDVAAISADRIATHTGGTVTITARGGASLIYDGATGNWRIYGFADENSSWNSKGNAGTVPSTNFIGTSDNQSFVTKTNNVERMRILNTGNVGIGTNNPDSKLHLANTSTGQTASANTILTLENNGDVNLNFLSGNSTTQKSGILFGSVTGNAKGQINYTPSLNRMDFATNDLTRMSIDGTGNVGIGTTTPDAKLDVYGDIRLSKRIVYAGVTTTLNNLNLQGAAVHKIRSISNVTLTGMAGGIDGEIVIFIVENGSTLIVENLSSGSTVPNRIYLPGSTFVGTITIVNGSITFMYDDDNGYWKVIALVK